MLLAPGRIRLSLAASLAVVMAACGGSQTAPSEPGLPSGATTVNVTLRAVSPDGNVEIFIDRMYPAPGGCAPMGKDLILLGRIVRHGGEEELQLRGHFLPKDSTLVGTPVLAPGAGEVPLKSIRPVLNVEDVTGIRFFAENVIRDGNTRYKKYWEAELLPVSFRLGNC